MSGGTESLMEYGYRAVFVAARNTRVRQFICSRCGRLGCLDRICHGGVDV